MSQTRTCEIRTRKNDRSVGGSFCLRLDALPGRGSLDGDTSGTSAPFAPRRGSSRLGPAQRAALSCNAPAFRPQTRGRRQHRYSRDLRRSSHHPALRDACGDACGDAPGSGASLRPDWPQSHLPETPRELSRAAGGRSCRTVIAALPLLPLSITSSSC